MNVNVLIKNETVGRHENMPCCQFEVSERQQILVLGVDFLGLVSKIDVGEEGVEAQPIGKLTQQNTATEIQVTNSLKKEGWDFVACPDPEIILITDNRILKLKR